jgi:hypothetical protein
MVTWHFSDGTVAKLGGEIEGGTAFAQKLRNNLSGTPLVPDGPMPSRGKPLDRSNPTHFDWFLRNEMNRPCNKWMMVSIIKAPEVEPLVLEEFEEEEGAEY